MSGSISAALAASKANAANGKAGGSVSGSSGASKVSREELIVLVQKLQKRANNAEQQALAFKKQLAAQQQQPQPREDGSAARSSPASSSSSSSSPNATADIASALSQAKRAIDEAKEEAKRASSDAAEWQKRYAELKEENSRLMQQVQAKVSDTETQGDDGTSGTGSSSSFLLENANRELKSALQSAQSQAASFESRALEAEKALADSRQSHQHELESWTSRVKELETKLANSDGKLVRSVALISEERSKRESTLDELKTLQSKVSQLQSALESSQQLLRESQQQVETSQAECNTLRNEVFQWQQRAEKSRSMDEQDGVDLRELRKTLSSKQEEILALRNELDHTRAIHARTMTNMENEAALTTQELERQVEEERSNVERVSRQLQELRTKTESERETFQSRIEELETELRQSTTTNQSLTSELDQQRTECEQLRDEFSTFRVEHDRSIQSANESYQALQTSSSEKYARLLQELKAYKLHTIGVQAALRGEIESLTATNQRLEEELKHGKPDERRIFELAALQAQRDEALREAESEVATYRQTAVELRGKMEQVKAERDFLAEELKNARNSQDRAQVNLDYLKSVMVQFLGYEHQPSHRRALFPVIARLLCFTPNDHAAVNAALAANEPSIWNTIGSAIPALGLGSASGKGAANKPLPASMPLGVNIDDVIRPTQARHDETSDGSSSSSSSHQTLPPDPQHLPASGSAQQPATSHTEWQD